MSALPKVIPTEAMIHITAHAQEILKEASIYLDEDESAALANETIRQLTKMRLPRTVHIPSPAPRSDLTVSGMLSKGVKFLIKKFLNNFGLTDDCQICGINEAFRIGDVGKPSLSLGIELVNKKASASAAGTPSHKSPPTSTHHQGVVQNFGHQNVGSNFSFQHSTKPKMALVRKTIKKKFTIGEDGNLVPNGPPEFEETTITEEEKPADEAYPEQPQNDSDRVNDDDPLKKNENEN